MEEATYERMMVGINDLIARAKKKSIESSTLEEKVNNARIEKDLIESYRLLRKHVFFIVED